MGMKLKVLIFLAIFSMLSFALTGCSAEGDCPDCKNLTDALQAKMFLKIDSLNYNATASVYYENTSTSPPRQPVNFSKVIVNVYNDSFSDSYIIYSDADGSASFNFSKYKDQAVSFKFLYCPFSNPTPGEKGYSECGFIQCIDFAGIECELDTCSISDISEADPIGFKPAKENYFNLLPTVTSGSYNPVATPGLSTPSICLPALIIFAMLGGALFLSGRNPFAGFDFSAPRMGRHMRYQARGRGVSVSAPTFVQQYMMGAASGLLMKGVGKALGAMAKVGGGKNTKALEGFINKATGAGGESGARAVVGPDGRVMLVGGGGKKGGKRKAPTMMDYIKGGRGVQEGSYVGSGILGSFKELYSEARRAPGVMEQSKIQSLAVQLGSSLDLSFSSLEKIAEAMVQFDAAAATANKVGGSKFSFSINGVEAVKNSQGQVVGIQIVDKSGKPVEFNVGGKAAQVVLNQDALRFGQVSGNVQVGERSFQMENGQIVAVSEGGKQLSGDALNNAIKSFDMKGFNEQLGKAPISMETRMYSDQFGGTVTAVYNPISVGETGNFEVIKPGSKGDANGIGTKFEGGTVKSITNLANNQSMNEIKGTDIKVGKNMVAAGLGPGTIDVLVNAYEAHQAYDNVVAAQKNFNGSTISAAGEAYAQRNPEALKALDRLSQNLDKKLEPVGLSGKANEYAYSANHIGIEASANSNAQSKAQGAGLASLGKKGMEAYGRYMEARDTPGVSEQEAWKKHVEPLINKNKEKFESAYMREYIDTYKSSLAQGYVQDAIEQAGRSGEKLSASDIGQLRDKSYDIASKFMDRTGLPEHIASEIKVPLSDMQVGDELNPDKYHLDKAAAYQAMGNAVKKYADAYRETRNNPHNFSAQELALGGISLQNPYVKETGFDAKNNRYGGSLDAGSLRTSGPTKAMETFFKNVGNAPKAKQNEMFFKAVYNLPQAADEAAKLAKKARKSK